jgi:folylpolyglutamate synthase/dihydropteroate synthase
MARIVHSRFAKIIITTPGTFKTSRPEQVYEAFAEIIGREKTELIKDTQEAVRQAILFAKGHTKTPLPILGTGSFYLVSEIRKFI